MKRYTLLFYILAAAFLFCISCSRKDARIKYATPFGKYKVPKVTI